MMKRSQIAYRGCAQVAAWFMTVLMWIAPVVYALNEFFESHWMAGAYAALGCFVVMKSLRDFAQGEADGNQATTEVDRASRDRAGGNGAERGSQDDDHCFEDRMTPTAIFIGMQERIDQPPVALYTIQGGPSDRSTVTAEKLRALGIAVPVDPSEFITGEGRF